jgi:hypothetical protein
MDNIKGNTLEKISVEWEWAIIRKIKEFFNKNKTPQKLTEFQFSDNEEAFKTGEEMLQYAKKIDLKKIENGRNL